MAHTSGPWKYDELHAEISTDSRTQRKLLAETLRRGTPEGAANGYLMAAAPDLLAALEDIISSHCVAHDNEDGFWNCAFCGRELQKDEKCADPDCMGVKARAAIKKAKGE